MNLQKEKVFTELLKKFFIFFVFFSTIPIPYFDSLPTMKTIYNISLIISLGIVLLIMLNDLKISYIQIIIWIFYIFYFGVTFLKDGNCKTFLVILVSTFSLCNMCEIFIKKDYNNFISIANIFFELIIYINLITIILFPNGLYEDLENKNPHYFLGHRNNSIEYILPGLCFSFLNSYYRNKKINIRSIMLLIVSTITVVLTWSATAVVAIGLIIIYFCFPIINYLLQNCTNLIHYFLASIGIFLLFIVFRLQEYFRWFIVNILHKDMEFSYRTNIWDKSIEYIKKSPIIGYGYEYFDTKLQKIGHKNSSHNYYLDLLYSGGIVLVSIYIILIIVIFKNLKKFKNEFESKIILGILAAYFIIGFTTPIHLETLSLMFLIFILGGFLSVIIENREEKCEK